MPERMMSVATQTHRDIAYNLEMTDEKSRFVRSLYQKHWSQLRNSILQLLPDRDQAEDIAQDSFLRINKLDKPQDLEFPYAYLYRTAVNLIRDRAKAQQVQLRFRESLSDEVGEQVDTLSPERNLIARERLERLSRTIDKLPRKCRQVFLMHKVQHMSHQDIAETLGISRHAVEKHIMRALARCQSSFEKDSA